MSNPLATPPPSFECPDELRVLWSEAFRVAGGNHTPLDYTEIDSAVDAFGRDAKARGIPPERFLIAIKDCMKTNVPPFDRSPAQHALREHTITRALDAYYGHTDEGSSW